MSKMTTPVLWLGMFACMASLGCTMCSQDHLWDYGGVGGKWQRSDPSCGRVGSILSDAGAIQSTNATEFSSNYGDSWGLVEKPVSMRSPDAQIIDGELFEGEIFEHMEPGSIMIGP